MSNFTLVSIALFVIIFSMIMAKLWDKLLTELSETKVNTYDCKIAQNHFKTELGSLKTHIDKKFNELAEMICKK